MKGYDAREVLGLGGDEIAWLIINHNLDVWNMKHGRVRAIQPEEMPVPQPEIKPPPCATVRESAD